MVKKTLSDRIWGSYRWLVVDFAQFTHKDDQFMATFNDKSTQNEMIAAVKRIVPHTCDVRIRFKNKQTLEEAMKDPAWANPQTVARLVKRVNEAKSENSVTYHAHALKTKPDRPGYCMQFDVCIRTRCSKNKFMRNPLLCRGSSKHERVECACINTIRRALHCECEAIALEPNLVDKPV